MVPNKLSDFISFDEDILKNIIVQQQILPSSKQDESGFLKFFCLKDLFFPTSVDGWNYELVREDKDRLLYNCVENTCDGGYNLYGISGISLDPTQTAVEEILKTPIHDVLLVKRCSYSDLYTHIKYKRGVRIGGSGE